MGESRPLKDVISPPIKDKYWVPTPEAKFTYAPHFNCNIHAVSMRVGRRNNPKYISYVTDTVPQRIL
jgi:hypothetical protein